MSSESPPVLTILPPCSSIAGSITFCGEPRSRSSVPASSKPDQAAVADHVGIDDGDQLPPIRRLPAGRCSVPRPSASALPACLTQAIEHVFVIFRADTMEGGCTSIEFERSRRKFDRLVQCLRASPFGQAGPAPPRAIDSVEDSPDSRASERRAASTDLS